MWSGNVAFGLVHIPVKMYAATEDRDVKFHQVHIADGGRIKYQRQCQTCEQTVTFAEIGKGYEDETGRRVIVSEEELDGLQVPHGRDLEIIEFAPADQIDPLHFDKAYFLEPATGAAKPYVLLRRALEETDRTAVVLMTHAQADPAGAAARARRRAGPADHAVARRGPGPGVRGDRRRGHHRPAPGAGHGRLARGEPQRGLRPRRLHRRVPPGRARPRHAEARRRGRDPAQQPGRADDSGTVIDLMAALQESVRRTQAARAASGAAEPETDAGEA